MLKMTPRELAIAGCVILALVLLATVVDATAANRVDQLNQPALERAAITAASTGGIRSSRYGDATPWMRRLSRELVERAFTGDHQRWALCVVERESGFNPGAISRTGDYGLAQLNRASHRWPHYGRLLVDPPYAIATFVRLSRGGTNRDPWRGYGYSC